MPLLSCREVGSLEGQSPSAVVVQVPSDEAICARWTARCRIAGGIARPVKKDAELGPPTALTVVLEVRPTA